MPPNSKTDGSGFLCSAPQSPPIPAPLPARTEQGLWDIDQVDFLGLSADGNDNQFFGQLNSSFARLDVGATTLELQPDHDQDQQRQRDRQWERQREPESELEFELTDPLPLSLISSADLDSFQLEFISNSDSDSDQNSDSELAGQALDPDRLPSSPVLPHPAVFDGSLESGPQPNQPSHHDQQPNISTSIDPTTYQMASSLSSCYSQSSFCSAQHEIPHAQPLLPSHPLKCSAFKIKTVRPPSTDQGYPPLKPLAPRPAPLKISKPPPLPIIAKDMPTPFSLSSSTSTAFTSLSTPPGSNLRYSTGSTRLTSPHSPSPSLNTSPVSPSKPPVWIVGQLSFTGRELDPIDDAEMSGFRIPSWAEEFVYSGAESGSATLANARPFHSQCPASLPNPSPTCSPRTQPTAISQAPDNHPHGSQLSPATPPRRRSGDPPATSSHHRASKPRTTTELPFRSPARPDFPQYELSETDEGLSDWFEAKAEVAAGSPRRRAPAGQFRRAASTPDHRCPPDAPAFGSGRGGETAFVYRRTSSQFDGPASRPGALSPLPEMNDEHLSPRWTFKGSLGGLVRSLKGRGSKSTSVREPAPGRRTSEPPNPTRGPKSPDGQSFHDPRYETRDLSVHSRRGTGLALALMDERAEGKHRTEMHDYRRSDSVGVRNACEKRPVRMSQIDPRLRMAEPPVVHSPALVQGPVQWG